VPHVTKDQVALSLGRLRPHHPMTLFTIPAMLRAGVENVATQEDANVRAGLIASNPSEPRYSGREEGEYMNKFFTVAGGPPGRPWYLPTPRPGQDEGQWVQNTYHQKSLQRQRTDRVPKHFLQAKDYFFPRGATWESFATALRDPVGKPAMLFKNKHPQLVPLFDMGAWLWRYDAFDDPQQIVDKTVAELKIPSELIGTVYDGTLPDDAASSLTAEALTPDDVAAIVGAAPPLPGLTGSFDALTQQLTDWLTDEAGMTLAPGLVGRIVRAWAARDIVILVGAGGTGKTKLAKGIARYLVDKGPVPSETDVEVQVVQEYATSDLLGYLNLKNEWVATPLTTKVLRSSNKLHPHVVLLEEFNLAQVEGYLGPILHAIESDSSVVLSGSETVQLPRDTLFLATCNSPIDDPETRMPLSGPSKRRATVIQVPNVLLSRFELDGPTGIEAEIAKRLADELAEIEGRIAAEQGTWLDGVRRSRLQSVRTVTDFDPLAREVLLDVVAGLLDTQDGRRWMTLGPLKDMVVQLAYAEADAQPGVVADLVIGKLLPQVQDITTADRVVELTSKLAASDAARVRDVVEAMRAPSGEVQHLV
jgi:MoxR-like ATPase